MKNSVKYGVDIFLGPPVQYLTTPWRVLDPHVGNHCFKLDILPVKWQKCTLIYV